MFIVEEEVSMTSYAESSIHTSDDSFEVDDDIVKDYHERLDLKVEEMPEHEIERNAVLKELLNKNKQKHLNLFGRKQIYLMASFNDWFPVEMRTPHEIKQLAAKAAEMEEMTDKQLARMAKSKRKEENVISFVNYLPPGKHFFYFIYQNHYIFLSPNYDVVRFKGANVLLNTITISERTA